MPTTSPDKPKRCDNASVGVLVERAGPGAPRWLFIWRARPPAGVAPVAGHVFDEHRTYEDAARAEVSEETGLAVTALHDTGIGCWRDNRCRREPGPRGTGHRWEVYTARARGSLAPAPGEASAAQWLSRPQVQFLANRTMLLARGRTDPAGFREAPGIEPVWVSFLASLDVITMPVSDLELIEELTR
jgi:ADP-ribose pyrophosphatase YjhB (NUDIX family)